MKSESGRPPLHIDSGRWLAQFTDRVLVVCPRCGSRALVVPRPDLREARFFSELMFMPRRLVCAMCGATDEWEAEVEGAALVGAALGGTEDPCFRQPLWLQTRCAGHILWAYNEKHLDELGDYVGAVLRERVASPTMAMFSRLPVWMKLADNRPEVLAGLGLLLALAERSAPEDRSDAAHRRDDRPRSRGSTLFRGGPY
jgi:DNA-directed RNA polymerase subunit RPC12/RpoP